jgi:DNA end-binding protein Ku
MAAIWKGTLSFGLVTLPVEMRTAVRDESLHFRLLHAEDNKPVKYERVCTKDGETVSWDEIVKGYEYSKGKFVIMTDQDFEAAALESSKAIDILEFVKDDEIDPRFFEKPYYLVPGKGGDKAYALLREALRSTHSVGIGKVTIRQKMWLVGIRAVDEAIVVESLRFANELVDSDEYSFPAGKDIRPQELKMAEQLVSNFSDEFDPTKYIDEYRENLLKIIDAKRKGKTIEFEAPAAPEETKVIDLMDKLRASLDASKSRGKQPASSGARKRTPASGGRSRSAKKAKKTA